MSLTQLRNLGIVANAGITTTKLGTGAVLQVTQLVSGTLFNTNSITFVTTGIEHSITPSSSSNKILIMIQGYCGVFGGSAQTQGLAIYKSTTKLYESSGAYNGNTNQGNSFSLIYLDSPSTTSSTTYTLRTKINAATANAYIAPDDVADTTITLMEIKA